MDWTPTRPRIEIAAEWSAALILGAAVALALVMLASAAMLVALCGAVGTAAAAIAVQRSIPPGVGANANLFEPTDWPDAAEGEEEALLLDEPVIIGTDEELLLDDPLPPAQPSRVVRLFGNAPVGETVIGDVTAIPGPGEMLARIETFLGADRDGALARGPAAISANAASAEASAALHAALADIRRSLRQG